MNNGSPPLLHALDHGQLAAAAGDGRWPKWSTMCQFRMLGHDVLNGVCITPDAKPSALRAAIHELANVKGSNALMVRSDGGVEMAAYYRGGNSFPIDRLEPHAAELLALGRAVILLEPTNRFINQLSVLMRLDRPQPGRPGTFTVEALGPGYDVGDMTRGGIRPQVTIHVEVSWHRYEPPWPSDLRVVRDSSPETELARRRLRLHRLGTHLQALDAGTGPTSESNLEPDAEQWLRANGHVDLWRDSDPTERVVRSLTHWYADAFSIAATHRNRDWRCLATALSDLGNGRVVYWDIVDAAYKYAGPESVRRST